MDGTVVRVAFDDDRLDPIVDNAGQNAQNGTGRFDDFGLAGTEHDGVCDDQVQPLVCQIHLHLAFQIVLLQVLNQFLIFLQLFFGKSTLNYLIFDRRNDRFAL